MTKSVRFRADVGLNPLWAPPAAMPTPAPPQLGARSYVLMDFNSGRLLAERDPDRRSDIASMTKLMTGYVVFQELAAGNVALDELVPVSERVPQAWPLAADSVEQPGA